MNNTLQPQNKQIINHNFEFYFDTDEQMDNWMTKEVITPYGDKSMKIY